MLVNDIEPDYIDNVRRITLNVGRMGPEERRRRRREIAAENINAAIIQNMISRPEDDSNNYKVNSFSANGCVYEIEVLEQKMQKCSCQDFNGTK